MQHDPLEFKQFSTRGSEFPKYIIKEDEILSVKIYDSGEIFLASDVTGLSGFQDGIRIAVNRDFGEESAKAYKERKLNKINEMLQENTRDWIQLERQESKDTRIKDLEEEIDGLEPTGYRLLRIIQDAKEDGLEPDKKVVKDEMKINEKINKLQNEVKLLKEKKLANYGLKYKKFREIESGLKTDKKEVEKDFKGQTNVCKIIFGDDGNGEGELTSYISFTVGSDGEPYGQQRIGHGRSGYWIHPKEIRELASAARQYGVSSFSMQFSAQRVSKRDLEQMRKEKKEEIMRKKRILRERKERKERAEAAARKRKERAEAAARQDEEDFMDPFEEVSFLKNPLRF